nr:hypothetical protein [Succinivibrio sp.]
MSNVNIAALPHAQFDTNKDYYLSNDGQTIKEAGLWHKFQCFFNIGNAREKGNNLIELLKRANGTAVAEAGTPDEICRDNSRVSGQALNRLSRGFTPESSSALLVMSAKQHAEKFIRSTMDRLNEQFVNSFNKNSDLGITVESYLRHQIAPLVNHPPYKYDYVNNKEVKILNAENLDFQVEDSMKDAFRVIFNLVTKRLEPEVIIASINSMLADSDNQAANNPQQISSSLAKI